MRIYWIALFLIGAAYASPPPVPSAGVVERELQKEYQAEPIEPGKEIPDVKIDIPEERLEIPNKGCVEVCRIEVRGNEAIGKGEVEGWVREYEGRKLCLKEIYEVCDQIDAGYAKRGYFLARSYPPPQTVKGGVLVLEVMEGRLGKVEVVGNRFYPTSMIAAFFDRLRGRALRYDEFMRAVLLLNETSDLRAGAVLTKGKAVGTVDVIVRVEDGSPRHLYLNANNYGRDLTTNFRAGGRFDGGSLGWYGDKLSIAGVVGFPVNALYFLDGVYRVPLGRNGTFLEFAYLFSKFKVEEEQSLHLSGISNIATVKGVYAQTRGRGLSIDGFGYFDYKQIQNLAFGTTTSFDKLRVVTLGYLFDRFPTTSGRDYLNVRMGVGIPRFMGALQAVSPNCSRVGAGGLFVKFNADYDRLQRFKNDIFMTFHVSAQGSFYKLPIPEQVYLGGADTVRGFPLSVVLGDSGYYANFELKMPPLFLADFRFFVAKKKWREIVQVVGFLDQGGTFFYGGSNTFLWGSGIGVRLKGPGSLQLSLDVGFPLNHSNFSTGAMTYIKITGQPI